MGQAQKARMEALSLRELHERTWQRQNQPTRECEPTFTLERQIAEARAEMGEDAWAKYQAEWIVIPAREGIEVGQGLNDTYLGDPVKVRASSLSAPTGERAQIVADIVRDVAELPDRSSPDDWPEAMLVTADELTAIVEDHLASLTPSKDSE